MLGTIRLKDFKSFVDETVELSPLTLLVGANASGKSNLFDAIRFLQGLGRDLPISDILRGRTEGGHVVWPALRGGLKEIARYGATDWTIATRWSLYGARLLHSITCHVDPKPAIEAESLGRTDRDELLFDVRDLARTERSRLGIIKNKAFLSYTDAEKLGTTRKRHKQRRDLCEALQSAMAGVLFLDLMPSRMRDYVPRDLEHLDAEGENLSAVVYRLCQEKDRKQDLVDWLSELCAPELADIDFVETDLGDVMMVLVEKKGTRISARSMSDGTLRFLGALVAVLTAPPGSMLLIEEIENGLHPARAHLLVEALESATRPGKAQIIATTHSPLVLQAMSREALGRTIVFGRHDDDRGTVMKKLSDLPYFDEIIERRGIDHLFTTRWLERAL